MTPGFYKKLRNIIIAGILVEVPIFITFAILLFIINIFENTLERPVSLVLKLFGLSSLIDYHISGFLGILLLIFVSLILGLVVTNVIGKKFIILGEKVLSKVPLVWNIYYASKQVMESTVSIRNRKALRQVVLVEYPRKGIYAIGFITSEAQGEVQEKTKEQVINIFLPTTPNPTSGMLIMVPREEIIHLSMSIEDGIKLIVSGGMVVPRYPGHLKKVF